MWPVDLPRNIMASGVIWPSQSNSFHDGWIHPCQFRVQAWQLGQANFTVWESMPEARARMFMHDKCLGLWRSKHDSMHSSLLQINSWMSKIAYVCTVSSTFSISSCEFNFNDGRFCSSFSPKASKRCAMAHNQTCPFRATRPHHLRWSRSFRTTFGI